MKEKIINNMIVYRHIRLDKNEPFYIGIGTDEKRAYRKSGRNKYWKNIISKTDYEVQILFYDLTKEEAVDKEKELIMLYGRKDLGFGTLVNMTDGGDGTFNKNNESKVKISMALSGRERTQEHKDNISKSRIGIEPWNKGKKIGTRTLTQEHKDNISKSRIGIEPWNKGKSKNKE
jgi:hypothetical protein